MKNAAERNKVTVDIMAIVANASFYGSVISW